MPATARRSSPRQTLQAGTWKGVRDTVEPYDDTPDLLVDATNLYIPDPPGGSAAFARPGFSLLHNRTPLIAGARGQMAYSHIAMDGTNYNFLAMGGRLFRVSNDQLTFTDVTPAAPVAISSAITTRVKMVSLGDRLIVSDGVNRPWMATNLGATPITGTNIDYDGANVAWACQDITIWSGALVVALKHVAGVSRQSDLSWSEPGQPDVGWQQLNFDNNWTLEQTGSSPIYALCGTNVALYYWRQRSIGAISGAIGPDLATTSTHDAVSFNVGTRAPQSIQTFGNTIYFTDTLGRPWRFVLGNSPEAIWLNMRAEVDAQSTGFPQVTSVVTTSAFEPTLNLYLVAIWSPRPVETQPCVQMYAFDARSGMYLGRWNIKGPDGVYIEAMGVFLDAFGGARLIVLGSKDPGGGSGYVWSFNALSTVTNRITTEGPAPVTYITTEGGSRLTTEGTPAVYLDDTDVPELMARTQRLGYASDVMWLVDRCTVITGTPTPIEVRMRSSTSLNVLQGTPSPSPSVDQTYRLVCGCRVLGRGTEVEVRAMSAASQWSLNRVQIVAVASQARPEDA
ncbi:MAG TPA: hypothetical protein VJO33_02785 [Gemmatimonadaceae bacterium]|nr:hypothetical protein [Gemmatimonadaceae bacterium]